MYTEFLEIALTNIIKLQIVLKVIQPKVKNAPLADCIYLGRITVSITCTQPFEAFTEPRILLPST